MKEFLPDDVALLQRLQETGLGPQATHSSATHMLEIRDPLTWVSCFLAYATIHAE